MKKTYIKPCMKWVTIDTNETLMLPTSTVPPEISEQSANYQLEQDVKQECSGGINSLWDEEW